MKICIYGAGAIGGFMGHALAQVPGVELSLIARGPHLKAMQENGLTLIRDGETVSVPVTATSNPAELGPQDYVVIALKSHQAWQSAESIKPLLGPNTAIITCQNGVPWWYFHKLPGQFEGSRLDAVDRGDRQWTVFGPGRAIGCVVYPATEIIEPGVIKHVYGDKFSIGEPDGTVSPRCEAFSNAMEQGGLRAPVLEDIRSEIWLKLWGNLCFNPISALTGATLDVVATEPGTRALAKTMMLEAQTLAEKLGASFRVDVERRINGAAGVGAHRTSMLQDLDAGKAMEIDALVTAVQEMGRIAGVATPAIDGVLALIQQLAEVRGLYPTYPAENGDDLAKTA